MPRRIRGNHRPQRAHHPQLQRLRRRLRRLQPALRDLASDRPGSAGDRAGLLAVPLDHGERLFLRCQVPVRHRSQRRSARLRSVHVDADELSDQRLAPAHRRARSELGRGPGGLLVRRLRQLRQLHRRLDGRRRRGLRHLRFIGPLLHAQAQLAGLHAGDLHHGHAQLHRGRHGLHRPGPGRPQPASRVVDLESEPDRDSLRRRDPVPGLAREPHRRPGFGRQRERERLLGQLFLRVHAGRVPGEWPDARNAGERAVLVARHGLRLAAARRPDGGHEFHLCN